ncbi:hypothetical protein B0T16DRAFT_338127 [Cercophora newfieldiana]|uniref:Uncharacterized protein n=1 Tax=Cercophora newfieldiana TaxID=92897 RepID=A0AA39XS76_9PEZI|nr:hypothetical protein B0T16DRAFT_338127 [Cercophora newfieldiana]
MTPSEKRRVPVGGSGNSPSRTGRTSTSNSNPSSSPRGPAAAGLAPPPRAALSGTSSPTPDDRRNRAPSPSSASASDASTVAAAIGAAVLREKDTRIAELERELLIMEREFTRELDKLSKAESERSTFWQAKYAALSEAAGQAERELARMREEGGWEEAVRARDEEIRDLRRQIHGLKEWVSTSTRSDGRGQVADEELGYMMKRLGNELQNWVLVNLRRVRIDVGRVDEATGAELGRLVPMFEELAVSSKVYLLQSLVSRVLVELVFDAYFVGLSGEQARQLTQVETFLASFASSPEPINQWRSQTLTILKGEANQRLQEETSHITDTIIQRVNHILDAITDTKPTDARDQGLRALVASAVELSRLLVVQKAIFKVAMPEILPHQQTIFDPATMEDMGGEDEEGLDEREICCVAFPGIIKRGDESGGHLQYRNVIAKARVLCSPE